MQGDADAMSEVSTRTDETELAPKENLLDLRITASTFDRIKLRQILNSQNQEIDPNNV